MYSVIEKVIFLQDIDVFSEVRLEELAHLAVIAEEVTFAPGEDLYRINEPSDSLFLILSGKVHLQTNGEPLGEKGTREALGSWALLDDEPRIATATALEQTETLRILREDFFELLSDHVRIAEAVLKGLAKQVKSLSNLGKAAAGRDLSQQPAQIRD